MKLYVHPTVERNFGDELNAWLWPKVVGPIFDEDDRTIFVGIGSTIYRDVFPAGSRKIVFGAGYGGYTGVPDVHDGTWEIAFVRGPRTARILGIDPALAITDAAVLVRTQYRSDPAARTLVSFIPHWESMLRGSWAEVCRLAGITLIDPRDPTEVVLDQIARSRVVIAEAMHGAIVADALRVPWIPVTPIHRLHRDKWLDWTESLNIRYEPVPLRPSNARELLTRLTGRGGLGPHALTVADLPVVRPASRVLAHLAAAQLRRLAQCAPTLSGDREIESATERVMEKVASFRNALSLR